MTTPIHLAVKTVVDARAKGNAALVNSTIAKLVMKGVGKAKDYYDKPDLAEAPGDLAKVKSAAAEMGVPL